MYDTLVDIIVRDNISLGKEYALASKALSDIADMQAEWQAKKSLVTFKPSFKEHIYPILCSMFRAMRIHSRAEGEITKYHLSLDPSHYKLLGGPNSDRNARREIFDLVRDPKTFRNPNNPLEPKKMPLTFGDFYDHTDKDGKPTHPGFFHSVSELQYELLRAWNDGRFVEDWDGIPPPAATVVTPHGLDRAALENAVGGAFYPGIEASWLFANPIAYREAFRVDYQTNPKNRKKLGEVPIPLSTGTGKRDLLLEAGAFSQQMAVPWPADFFECSATDFQFGNPPARRRIAWWPAQRPDDVFVEADPTRRIEWARDENGPFQPSPQGDLEMVKKWSRLGFIVDMNGELFEVGGPPVGPTLVAGGQPVGMVQPPKPIG
jgi:hypothetical protein